MLKHKLENWNDYDWLTVITIATGSSIVQRFENNCDITLTDTMRLLDISTFTSAN